MGHYAWVGALLARGWRARLLCSWGALLLAASATAQELDELESSSEWDALMMMAPPEAPATEAKEEPSGGKRPKKRGKGKKKSNRRKETADGYARLRESWHTPVEDGSWGTVAEGGAVLVLRSMGQTEPVVLTPANEAGGFDEGDITFASQLLGTWAGGPSVHPRLLDLIYQAVRHFQAPYVNVVSGIRRDRKGSRHSHGYAADIVLPGVDDEELAAFFRPKGFVGVGTYPRGGFVHIDVREQSYFWVDRSAPGSRRSRMHQVRAGEAKAADEAAIARGEGPVVNPEPLRKALHARAVRRNKAGRRAKPKSEERPKRARAKHERRAAEPEGSATNLSAVEGGAAPRGPAAPATKPGLEPAASPAAGKPTSEVKRRERS